jgi:hypothetical protein
MAEIDVGDAAMAGVRMITRQPFSVLTWGLLMAILVGLLFLVFGGGLAATISSIVTSSSAGATPTAAEIFGLIAGAFGFLFLLVVGAQLLDLVIRAAAMRAELQPEAHSFAYLRFGSQELWLLAASLVFWMVMLGANIAMSIPVAIISAVSTIGSVSAASQGAPDFGAMAGAAGVRLIGQLIILAVSIWLWLRLSLGVVMTFRDQQFRLFESWALTRGHVWRMFLTMLLVFLMLLAVSLVLWTIGLIAVGATVFSAVAPDPKAFFSRPPAEWMAALTPVFVVFLIGIVVSVGVGNALIWGAVARMWRQLNPDADVAKTFA